MWRKDRHAVVTDLITSSLLYGLHRCERFTTRHSHSLHTITTTTTAAAAAAVVTAVLQLHSTQRPVACFGLQQQKVISRRGREGGVSKEGVVRGKQGGGEERSSNRQSESNSQQARSKTAKQQSSISKR